MDNFSYTYLNIGSAPSNRLGHVSDAVTASANTDDIESQNPNNYDYDQLGQLIGDQQEQIFSIEWRSGDKKIKKLTRTTTAGNKSDIEFVYNPMGQRILKIEKTRTANVLDPESSWKYTYYTYDANGQVMATYAVKLSSTVNRATLTEQNIYGASRLGIRRKDVRLYENGTSPYVIPAVQQNTLGNIAYEITNYLGNVNVVISDRKLWVPTSSAFKAVVLSRTDYFPFGMEISSRTTNSDNYRFGYNGMESDNETKGSGNSYTTEFRQYDPRIGRWLSLDPLMAQFPWQSPYCAFDNNPVFFTDPLGLAAEGCEGDPPAAGSTKINPATGTVYTADGKGEWLQNIQEVNVKPQSLNDFTSEAVQNNTSNYIKEISESTNPNLPKQGPIIIDNPLSLQNKKTSKTTTNYQPPVMEQKLMADHMELAVRNYKNYGAIANPLHTAMTTVAKLSTGQNVTMEDAVWSVVDITPAKYLKYGKYLVPKVAKQVSQEVAEVTAKKLRNSRLAGKVHPKTGVPFDKSGFPNFSNNLYKGGINDVMIKPTGNRVADFIAANKAAGYSSTPKGFTWHHHQTTGRMQLVETEVHSQTGHTGGFSLWKY